MSQQGLQKHDEQWIVIQKKTFTKWVNNHLRRRGFPIMNDVQEEFENGIRLMQIVNSLYNLDFPKHNKDPKMRPHKLDNVNVALKMLEKAEVKTNFLKDHHLVDKDLKMILGMIWSIILDYQIKGVSEDQLSAREGLLLWCQKCTKDYKDVKIENFTNSWQNGNAFLALIHRHRPDMLDYDGLDKSNPKENLELAFTLAEKLGIPRLLDVEDICDVPKPDEKSIMTYVSEYFLCFASQRVKEVSAGRVQKFVAFNRSVEESQQEYESKAAELIKTIDENIHHLNERNFSDSYDDAKSQFDAHRDYLVHKKPALSSTKLDLESIYASIQTKLQVYGRSEYKVPAGFTTEDVDAAFEKLERSEKERGEAVRKNLYRFVTKATHTVSDDQVKEFEAEFARFDKDGDQKLTASEFKAACSSLGIPFKDEAAFNTTFKTYSEGAEHINKEQFVRYMISITEDKDTAEAIEAAFRTLADNANTISAQQLRVFPLQDADIQYLTKKMPGDNTYDYASYTKACFK